MVPADVMEVEGLLIFSAKYVLSMGARLMFVILALINF